MSDGQGGALGEVRRAIEARSDAEMAHQGAWNAYMRGDGYENERRLKDAEERMGAAKAALDAALAAVEARIERLARFVRAYDAVRWDAPNWTGLVGAVNAARAALTAEDVAP